MSSGLSLLVHGTLLALPTGLGGDNSLSIPLAPRLRAEQLTVNLAAPVVYRGDPRLPSPDGPLLSGALMIPGTQQIGEESRAGAPQRPHTKEPAVITAPNLDYLSARELTLRPHPVRTVPLETQEIRFRKETGKVHLALWISEQGVVDRIDVERSDLPPLYAQTARKAFAETRFHPGEHQGRPVKARMWIEVSYVPLMVPVMAESEQSVDQSAAPR